MSFIRRNINIDINNYCNCGFNSWLSPMQNFNFFNFNFNFNFGLFNFRAPFGGFGCFGGYVPYDTPSYPIFNYNPPQFNMTNSWAQFGGYNSSSSWSNFYTPAMDSFTYTSTIPQSSVSKVSTSSVIESKKTVTKASTTYVEKQRTYGSLQEKYYKTALSYVGKINSDKAGNREFSNGRDEAWCANMVTTLAHKTFGDKLPEGMPDGRKGGVASKSLATWAQKHDRWLKAPSDNLGDYIAQNVRPGDIVILDRGGSKGHAAIVTKVHSDGSFETVEGNSSNSVKTRTRPATIDQPYGSGTNRLMGFVQMGDIA